MRPEPEVIYEDNHLLAVNKPAGMPVQGDQSGDEHLLQWAAAYLKHKYQKPGDAFVGLIHRLDRPVSGVVVLAKTSKALTRMNELFRSRNIEKEYRALCTRTLPETSGKLEHFLDKDTRNNRAIVYRKEKPGAKPAMLEYELIKSWDGNYLYRVLPHSGRFHQIRAQLAFSGAPIVGDLKYGYPFPNPDKSICLHAAALRFMHPIRNTPVVLEAVLPAGPIWRLPRN